MIRVIMEFDDSWTFSNIQARIRDSQAFFSAERVTVEEVHGIVEKDRAVQANHGRVY